MSIRAGFYGALPQLPIRLKVPGTKVAKGPLFGIPFRTLPERYSMEMWAMSLAINIIALLKIVLC